MATQNPIFGLCAAKDRFGKGLFTIARGAIFFFKMRIFFDLSDGKKIFSKKSLKNGQNRGFLKILDFLKNRVCQKSIVFNRFSMTWEKNEYHHRKDRRKIHIFKKKIALLAIVKGGVNPWYIFCSLFSSHFCDIFT